MMCLFATAVKRDTKAWCQYPPENLEQLYCHYGNSDIYWSLQAAVICMVVYIFIIFIQASINTSCYTGVS